MTAGAKANRQVAWAPGDHRGRDCREAVAQLAAAHSAPSLLAPVWVRPADDSHLDAPQVKKTMLRVGLSVSHKHVKGREVKCNV